MPKPEMLHFYNLIKVLAGISLKKKKVSATVSSIPFDELVDDDDRAAIGCIFLFYIGCRAR